MKKFLFFFVMLFAASLLNAQTIVFHENFEPTSNADSVTASGALNNFAINSRLFHSGVQCDSSLVTPNDTAYLTTNSFSTAGNSFVFLNFSHICKIELLDGGEVQVSIDNGVTWTSLTGTQYVNPGNSQFVTNGNKFNSNTYPLDWAPASGTAKPTNSWWKNESFNISALVGNQPNVKIRFALRDGNGNGAFFNHGWYIDDITVSAALSELTPPTIVMKPPVIQDTIFSTGPFSIYAWIKDASGIDTAYITYKVNNGANINIPMTFVSDSTYLGIIPSYSYNNRIDYTVYAKDNSASHNLGTGPNKWFYIKKPPSSIQIGTGTLASYYYGPIYRSSAASSFDYSQYFYVITAAELAAAGLPAGTPITKIEWYKTDANSTTGNAIFNIWMKNSSSTGYSAPTPWSSLVSGATQVYNSTTQTIPGSIGWIPFNISPFIYSGGALEIGTDWNISGVTGNPATGAFNFQYTGGFPTNYTLGASAGTPITANLTNITYGGAVRPNVKIYYAQSTGNNDAGVTQIVSPAGNQIANVNLPVTVQIKNFGTDSLKKATIQWKLDGVLQTPSIWLGGLPEAVTSSPFQIGTVNVGVGPHVIKAWTTFPNDSIDDLSLNDTANISFYACTSGLSGTYTVGGVGADYPTFTDVMTALNNCGVNGPTIFKINAGTYSQQLTFNSIYGVSATNTITFMPNTGASVVITNNSTTSTIKLNGADYIIFDGSNNGTTTRDMSIINTSILTNTAAIWLASTATPDGCNNNVIKNCIIQAGANTSGTYGINIGGASIGLNGADNDNNTIQNNSISKAYVGIWAQGSASSNPGLIDNTLIKGNSIGSTLVAEYIGHDGIILGNASGCNVEKNTIFNIITTVVTPVGLTLSSGVVSSNVIKNNINNVIYTGTAGYGGRGLYANSNSLTSNLTIANNLIYKIGGDGYTSFAGSSPVGMYFDGVIGGLNIYYNSVYMSGNLTYATATLSAAVLFNSTTLTSIKLNNNIFQNSMVNTVNTGAKNYAIYSMVPGTSFTSINYNDYYTTGSQGILGYLGGDKTTITAWRTATTQDVNSMNVIPAFLSTTDLHTFSSDINAHGTPIAAITDDIDGNLRNVTYPDLGAYEFDIAAKNISIVSVIQPVSNCSLSATANVVVRLKNVGSANIDTADVYYRKNGGAPVHEVMIHTIMPDSVYNYTFTTPADLSVPGNYTFKVYAHVNGDTTHINDTIQNYTIYSGYNFNSSPYTQSFEPTEYFADWSTLDVNADNFGWTMPFVGATDAHTGNNSVRLYNGGTNSGNDWLFSRCFSMQTGNTYKIEFWYKVSNASYPQIIDLKVGNNNTVPAMTTTLTSLISITNTTYQKATATFTPTTSGTYYFGWYGHSVPNGYYAFIDDINITILPPQEATLVSIKTPNTGCGLSTTEQVKIKVQNTGALPIQGNFTAYYKVDNGPIYSEVIPNLIAPNDTLLVTFAQTANLSVTLTDQTFNIKSWVVLLNDPLAFNDTVNKPVTSYHVPTPPIVANANIPWGTSTTLNAVSPDSVFWYDAPVGGNQLAISHHYTTPILFSNTVYYAEAALFTPNIVSTIGNGTSTQGWPFYTFYMDSKTQMLYTASEIIAAGGGAGNIDKIAFNINSAATQVMNGFSIQMQTTSLSALTGFVSTGWTTVYSGNYTVPGTGWQDIVLQTPYFYDGSSNLLINVCFDNASYTSNSLVYSSTTTGKVWHEHQDLAATSGCVALIAGTTQTERPNIRLNQSAKGCSSPRVADTVFMNLFPYDANLLTVPAPVSSCSGTPEHVTIRVRNNGVNTINSFDAKYKVNGAPIVSETVNSQILPGDTLTYTFTTTFNAGLSSANLDSIYNIKTFVVLAADPNQANDTVTKTVTLYYVPSTPIVVNDTIPYSTSTTLFANTSDSVAWYNVPVGGLPISTNHYFTTPTLYVNTVYYAEAINFNPTGPVLYSNTTSSIGNGATAVGYPFYTFYMDSKTQMLYSAAEILAAGGASGEIGKIAFDVITADPANMGSFTIEMQNTSLTSLSGFVSTGWTTVYTGTYAVPGTGWQEIVLQNPFFWNGTSNLLINICFDNSSYTSNSTLNSTSAAGMTWHEYADLSGASGCGMTAGIAQATRPNIKLNQSARGCVSARVADTVFISLLNDEASLLSIISPVSSCSDGSETVTIKIRNNGSDTINSMVAKYSVNGAPVVSETITTPIYYGDTLTYTFNNTFSSGLSVSNPDSVFNILAYIELTGDPMQSNDTLSKTVTLLYTPPVPTVSNVTIPYGTSATLHAVSSDSINWYNVPTGGSILSNSSTFTTPALYNTTVFYAESINGSGVDSLFTTTAGGNGCGGGNMFDITSLTGNQTITGFAISPYAAGALPVSVYYKTGTYVGSETNAAAWTLVGTYNLNPTSANTLIYLDCGDFVIPAGQTYGIYLNFNATYTTLTTITTYSNAAMQLTAGVGLCSAFGGTNTPRGFNGKVYYGSGNGCASARVADTVFVSSVPPCDMSVETIHTPVTGTLLSANSVVRVRVKNFGTDTATNIPIHYKVNNLATVNEVIPGPMASNDTLMYTFTTPVNLSTPGTYNFKVYTDLPCDSTQVNDTAYKTVICNALVYCTSVASTTADEEIFSVTLNGATNAYSCTQVAPGPGSLLNRYSNFTTLPPLTTLSMGVATPFSIIEDECDGPTYYANGIGIWIDCNRDGDFDDAGETMYQEPTTNTGPRTLTGMITVPPGSFVGVTTMRIICAEGYSGTQLIPCLSYGYGETEDYNIRISPPIPHDAGALSFYQPTAIQDEGVSVPVQLIVKNFGTDTIKNSSNMTVAYKYASGAVQSLIWSGGNIPPLDTALVTLPNLTVLANAQTLCGWTILAGDSNTFNDTICTSILGVPQLDAGVTTIITPGTQLIQGASETVEVIIKNFGVDTLTSMNVSYTINGGVPTTQLWTGNLLPSLSATVLFTTPFTVPASTFSICAYTSQTPDANHANDTTCKSSYGVFTSQLPYYDNFDGPVVNFSQINAGNGTLWELGTPNYNSTNSAFSPPNAWDINLNTAYGSSANAALYTQNFNFSNATSAKIKFMSNHYTEGNYDGVRLEYSTDTGVVWNVLGVMNDPLGLNWYNIASIYSSSLPAWSDNSNGWTKHEYKLIILDSVPLVRFRFVFTSDPSVNYDGFSIDDFSITIPSSKDAGVIAITEPAVQAAAGSQEVVKVRIQNFGLDTLTSIPVSYATNGGAATTETWTGSLAPDSTAIYQFTGLLTVPSGAFSLCSYTGLPLDGDHLNDTTCATITGVPTFNVPYSDDMEGTVYFFTPGTLWEHGAPTASVINAPYSPINVWATNLDGDYPNGATEFLYTPLFNFSTVDSAYLDFYHWYNTQSTDGCNIQYSINGGANWITLGLQNDPAATNWYNANIGGTVCWTGNSTGYVHSRFRLTSIPTIINSPVPVQFRFRFFSDGAGVANGWAVDDFQIEAPPIPYDAGVSAILQPNAPTETGTQVVVQVTLKNYGTNTLTNIPVRYRVNNGAVTSETWNGSLLPNATANYTFTATYQSPGSTYELCAFTVLPGDTYFWNDTTCGSYATTPGAKDVGVTKIWMPGDTTVPGDSYSVTVTIKNFGFNIETAIPMVYLRNGVQAGAGNWSGTLSPGDTTVYTFPTQYVSPLGNYSLCAKTQLVGDVNPANDQLCKNVFAPIGIESFDFASFDLLQNIPNPANNLTSIVFYVPSGDNVSFDMEDLIGNAVMTKQIDAVAGKNQMDIDVANIPAGIYFYSVSYKDQKRTKRMVITK